jgi:hypothetical protein
LVNSSKRAPPASPCRDPVPDLDDIWFVHGRLGCGACHSRDTGTSAFFAKYREIATMIAAGALGSVVILADYNDFFCIMASKCWHHSKAERGAS